ncbi:probable serine/threonine-protein kinase abkD [Pistacia vera]|uniref:probable serine/threonine-protein kinase abkD n=1 Tax=Pistacia vera TaxID=55513 RepID=UPI0012630842|nr:probable serine/threonine-protein kinase abkD [Pistacia vera]
MGWGNIYIRRIKVYKLAFRVFLDYKVVQIKAKWIEKSKRDGLWEEAHNRNGKRIVNLITELNGLWVKLGQYLSGRADVLPVEYITLLKQLQDSLPQRPVQEVVLLLPFNLNLRSRRLWKSQFDFVRLISMSRLNTEGLEITCLPIL